MSIFSRREFLKTTAGVAASGTWVGTAGCDKPTAGTPTATGSPTASNVPSVPGQWVPEQNASLRVLRWKRFVAGDEEMWTANTKKFTEKTGIQVRVDQEGWEDVRPKAAVAASVGGGPDIIISTSEDAHQYPDKLVDVSDICEYLGGKYGGWYDSAVAYCKHKGTWVAVPMGCAGGKICYRRSAAKTAGFDTFPKDLPGLLKLAQALKAKKMPPGFALGHATGDANGWCHWLVWAHGGKMVDANSNVVINSPETLAALEYAKEFYETFIPGTLSWLDSNNNKAFLDGQIGITLNGISIFYAAKISTDAKLKQIAVDIGHADMPIGPVGRPTELSLVFPMMIFKYSKYPSAAKAYLSFMMEQDQYLPWQKNAFGYVTQPLKAYETNPIWTEDPNYTPYRDAMQVMLPNGYAGEMGYASARVMADFVMVDMVAEAASGAKTPKEAAERAQKRAERYYKV
ncbi:MAG TPA: extracellular solute-binding protein [Polyangiaceae bacterium]|nr:extracellular solute-binding protein [Polyangiaceae bacterium]